MAHSKTPHPKLSLKKWPIAVLSLFLILNSLAACRSSSSTKQDSQPQTQTASTSGLRLNQGLTLHLGQFLLDESSLQKGGLGRSTLSLEEPGGAEGLSLTWSSLRRPQITESQPQEQEPDQAHFGTLDLA